MIFDPRTIAKESWPVPIDRNSTDTPLLKKIVLPTHPGPRAENLLGLIEVYQIADANRQAMKKFVVAALN